MKAQAKNPNTLRARLALAGLNQIEFAEEYGERYDSVRAVIQGKRGKGPVAARIIRKIESLPRAGNGRI